MKQYVVVIISELFNYVKYISRGIKLMNNEIKGRKNIRCEKQRKTEKNGEIMSIYILKTV